MSQLGFGTDLALLLIVAMQGVTCWINWGQIKINRRQIAINDMQLEINRLQGEINDDVTRRVTVLEDAAL